MGFFGGLCENIQNFRYSRYLSLFFPVFRMRKFFSHLFYPFNYLCFITKEFIHSMQRLVTGNLTRIDLTIIAKLCNELQCNFEDIVEYVNERD